MPSEKWQNAALTFAGTFITSLIAQQFAGVSDILAKGVANALYAPTLQAALMFVIALGFQAGPTQKLLGRRL